MYNWVDLIILTALVMYVAGSLSRNFWAILGDLVSFLGSLFVALRFYPLGTEILLVNFQLSANIAKAISFVAISILARIFFGIILTVLISKMPKFLREFKGNRFLGLVPAFADAVIFVSIFVIIMMILPLSPLVKKDIVASRVGGRILTQSVGVEQKFKEIFGGVFEEALNFLTIKPQSNESIDLRFKTSSVSIDSASEQQMFNLVNSEREKTGLAKLSWNQSLTEVARGHSKDMFERGYFSHYSPEGKDVGNRLKEAGINYFFAGENLAYAPSVSIAHQGLMNSPGHKANILNKDYRQIGIGVYDGGIYGKMFTQAFTN